MAVTKKNCINHPERDAIGICIITRKPICGECSTRYEGVNYSKEGLRILKERKAAEHASVSLKERLGTILSWLSVPILGFLLYKFYLLSFLEIIKFCQKI